MASVRRRDDFVRVSLTVAEASLLAGLASQTVAVLGGAVTPSPADPLEQIVGLMTDGVASPDDPIVQRLLPDAYRDDDEAAGEFRRLTDADLRATKCQALQRIIDELAAPAGFSRGGGPRLDLAEETAVAWLHGLADIRLALGTQLDVGEDIDAERARLTPESPGHAELAVYDWLSWLQDALVHAVSVD